MNRDQHITVATLCNIVNLAVDNGLKAKELPDGNVAFYRIEPKQWLPCYPFRDGWRGVLRDMFQWWQGQRMGDVLPPVTKEETALKQIGRIAARLVDTHSRYPDCYREGITQINAIANGLTDQPLSLEAQMELAGLEGPKMPLSNPIRARKELARVVNTESYPTDLELMGDE